MSLWPAFLLGIATGGILASAAWQFCTPVPDPAPLADEDLVTKDDLTRAVDAAVEARVGPFRGMFDDFGVRLASAEGVLAGLTPLDFAAMKAEVERFMAGQSDLADKVADLTDSDAKMAGRLLDLEMAVEPTEFFRQVVALLEPAPPADPA